MTRVPWQLVQIIYFCTSDVTGKALVVLARWVSVAITPSPGVVKKCLQPRAQLCSYSRVGRGNIVVFPRIHAR